MATLIKLELYERCINLAMRMLEKEYYKGSYSNVGGYDTREIIAKYNEKEVFELADKIYKKIKSAK